MRVITMKPSSVAERWREDHIYRVRSWYPPEARHVYKALRALPETAAPEEIVAAIRAGGIPNVKASYVTDDLRCNECGRVFPAVAWVGYGELDSGAFWALCAGCLRAAADAVDAAMGMEKPDEAGDVA